MTEQEARIVVLEDALKQAQNTVEFLHNCLVNPVDRDKKTGCLGYSYKHPDHTLQELKKWKMLAPRLGKHCYHSSNEPDCEVCQVNHKERIRLYEARKALNME